MMARIFVLFLSLLLSCTALKAEDISYLKHKKYFWLCSFKKECNYCESCTKELLKVRIQNNAGKRIKNVYYQYYSPLYSRTITNDAVIQGDVIEPGAIANIYVCVKGQLHWAISKIVYQDDSEVTFTVDEPMKSFMQEADECDCNLLPEEHR